MNDRSKPFSYVSMLLLAGALGGCATPHLPEKVEDPRLDQLLAGMEQSLANQAAVSTQLQEQQRRLDLQQQQLESLSQGVAREDPRSTTRGQQLPEGCGLSAARRKSPTSW